LYTHCLAKKQISAFIPKLHKALQAAADDTETTSAELHQFAATHYSDINFVPYIVLEVDRDCTAPLTDAERVYLSELYRASCDRLIFSDFARFCLSVGEQRVRKFPGQPLLALQQWQRVSTRQCGAIDGAASELFCCTLTIAAISSLICKFAQARNSLRVVYSCKVFLRFSLFVHF